jgi:hypothetical protein
MSSKARITSVFATEEQVASRLRIPTGRVAELRRMYNLYIAHPDGSATVVKNKRSRRNGKPAQRKKR